MIKKAPVVAKITPPIEVAILPSDFWTLLPIVKPNRVKEKLQTAKLITEKR